jgi:hypothetical protein
MPNFAHRVAVWKERYVVDAGRVVLGPFWEVREAVLGRSAVD